MAELYPNGNFKVNSRRTTVEIVLPDGRVYTGRRGSTLAEILKVLPEWDNPPIMGAVVNGELRELTTTIEMDARVRLVTMKDDDARAFIAGQSRSCSNQLSRNCFRIY